ncbi:hypothetical protein B4U79_10617, partial [Dinothrombium tinctorium]
ILEELSTDDKFFEALREIAVNCLEGNIKLNPKLKTRLKKHKKIIRALATEKKRLNRRRIANQIGGILPFLIPAAATTLEKVKRNENIVEDKKLTDTILQIILKLAKINGYNENFEIRDRYGNFIANSNILQLVKESEKHEDDIQGLNEFIELLQEAKIDPNLITNQSIKANLISLYNQKPLEVSTEKTQKTNKEKFEKSSKDKNESAKKEVLADKMEENTINKEKENAIETFLKNIYYSTQSPVAFTSLNSIYNYVKKHFPGISKETIENWLNKQPAYALHHQIRKKFTRNRIFVTRIDELWQCDLVDLQQYHKDNSGYKFILTIIDVFS